MATPSAWIARCSGRSSFRTLWSCTVEHEDEGRQAADQADERRRAVAVVERDGVVGPDEDDPGQPHGQRGRDGLAPLLPAVELVPSSGPPLDGFGRAHPSRRPRRRPLRPRWLIDGFVGRADDHAEHDHVLRRQRAGRQDDATGVAHGVAQRDRPEVLDGEHEGRAAVGQVVEHRQATASAAVSPSGSAAAPISAPATAPSTPA